jgi:gas vesicle protein/ribosomal protein L37AE/L43A
MLFLLIGAAVGAVAGACIAHASNENTRQSSKHQRRVANKITTDYSSLKKKYDNLANTTQRQVNEQTSLSQTRINDLTRINAQNEEEKDLLRLTIRLQQSLYSLMLDIEKEPSKESLAKFEQAILATNTVLSKLNEELFKVPDTYFSRNLKRAMKVEGKRSTKTIEGKIYPVKQCRKCGRKNRIHSHSNNHHPICGNCKYRLAEEIIESERTTLKKELSTTQENKSSTKIKDRDYLGTFSTYESYINWFQVYCSSLKPLSEQNFYYSWRYAGRSSQRTEKTKSRNNRKSPTDLSFLD